MDSMTTPEPNHCVPTSDPVIYWPGESRTLAAFISDLTRLNPHIDLGLVNHADKDGEFLSYAGSALDVVTIALPQPLSDQFYSDLTDLHKDWMRYETEMGKVQVGPRRFERTSDGHLHSEAEVVERRRSEHAL
jgi:hypothetical protein